MSILVIGLALFTATAGLAQPIEGELDLIPAVVKYAAFSGDDVRVTYKPALESDAGSVSVRTLGTDPFLGVLPAPAISSVLVKLGPCAISQAHTHPRATEHAYVTRGQLRMGFVEELGGPRGVVDAQVKKGDTFVFPEGLLHFIANERCSEGEFHAVLNDADGGTQLMAGALLSVPDSVLRATVGSEDIRGLTDLRAIVAGMPIPSADPTCLKRCGLA